MKFLKNERAWKRWANKEASGQPQAPFEPPKEYPCFAYTTVLSYGYEEDRPIYLYRADINLYRADIMKMAFKIAVRLCVLCVSAFKLP